MKKGIILLILANLSLLIISSLIISPTNAQSSLSILVVGNNLDDSLTRRIQLDPSFEISFSEDIGTEISSYDSLLIFDYVPSTDEINLLNLFSGGIAVFIYKNLAENASILETLGLATTTNGAVYQIG